MTLHDFNTLVLAVGIVLPGVLFLGLYVPFVRIRTWAGWNIVAFTAAIVTICTLAILRRMGWAEWGYYEVLAAVCFLLVAAAMWQRLMHLITGPTFNWRVIRRRDHKH